MNHRRLTLALIAAFTTAACTPLHLWHSFPAAPPAADTTAAYQLIQEPEHGYGAIDALLDRARTSIRRSRPGQTRCTLSTTAGVSQ